MPYGRPGRPRTAPDHPVEVLRALGLDLGDPQRSEDLLAASRSREREDRQDAARQVAQLAAGLQKARRREFLATADWRANPSSANLAELEACIRTRSLLESDLREACLNDEDLIDEVKRRAAGR